MTNPTIKIHNVETNEVIEREMTAEEIAWLESTKAIPEPTEEELAKAATKAALLARLGMTADEAKLLLS